LGHEWFGSAEESGREGKGDEKPGEGWQGDSALAQ